MDGISKKPDKTIKDAVRTSPSGPRERTTQEKVHF